MKLIYLTISIFLLAITGTAFSQKKYTDEEIKIITDSILREANVLYNYEETAWLATDAAMIDEDIRKDFSSYLIYQSGDTMRALILNEFENCILQVDYRMDDFSKVLSQSKKKRKLTENEQHLLDIKNTMIGHLNGKRTALSCPSGYNLNSVLIPKGKKYYLYILTGTSRRNIIPLGNDYLFIGNKKGRIVKQYKFHSKLIAQATQYGDNKVVEIIHSHLKDSPFITATDICTFRLYGSLYGIDKMGVYSTALHGNFYYTLSDNKLVFEARSK